MVGKSFPLTSRKAVPRSCKYRRNFTQEIRAGFRAEEKVGGHTKGHAIFRKPDSSIRIIYAASDHIVSSAVFWSVGLVMSAATERTSIIAVIAVRLLFPAHVPSYCHLLGGQADADGAIPS